MHTTLDGKKFNFIVITANDNDFSTQIKSAIDDLALQVLSNFHNDATLRNAIISHIVGTQLHRASKTKITPAIDWEKLQHTEHYLKDKLNVSFVSDRPKGDSNSDSVCYDIYTEVSYIF